MAENDQHFNIQELAEKWAQGKLSPEEQAYLEKWYAQFDDVNINLKDSRHANSDELRKAMIDQINERLDAQQHPIRRLLPWKSIAAASILIAVSAGGYFLLHKKHQSVEIAQLKPGTFKNDALPGNNAILTLGNGQQVAVTSLPAGKINNVNAQKTANGDLIYSASSGTPDEYNTFTVLRGGGKHELKLADGTLVLLDAESSIRYPVAFNGKDRRVTITGQVYFEVKHNSQQPFYVTAGDQTIEDIGTHFNVNAFDGEVTTTLIEGSIKVNNNMLLKPGQQVVQGLSGNITVLNNVDEEIVLAWKNDLFKFGSNTTLQTVMSQLSRWYDLDVQYQGNNKQHHFAGYVPRNSKLSEVCKILEYSGVKFSLEGKKITVYQ